MQYVERENAAWPLESNTCYVNDAGIYEWVVSNVCTTWLKQAFYDTYD